MTVALRHCVNKCDASYGAPNCVGNLMFVTRGAKLPILDAAIVITALVFAILGVLKILPIPTTGVYALFGVAGLFILSLFVK